MKDDIKDVEEKIEEKIEQTATQVKNMVTYEFRDILDFVKKPWKLVWINFLIGIARGTGFILGMTIFGALIITLLVILLHKMVDLPVIGSFVADIIIEVKKQLANMPPR